MVVGCHGRHLAVLNIETCYRISHFGTPVKPEGCRQCSFVLVFSGFWHFWHNSGCCFYAGQGCRHLGAGSSGPVGCAAVRRCHMAKCQPLWCRSSSGLHSALELKINNRDERRCVRRESVKHWSRFTGSLSHGPCFLKFAMEVLISWKTSMSTECQPNQSMGKQEQYEQWKDAWHPRWIVASSWLCWSVPG